MVVLLLCVLPLCLAASTKGRLAQVGADITAKEEFVMVRALENFVCDMRELKTLSNLPMHLRFSYRDAELAMGQFERIYRAKPPRCANPPIVDANADQLFKIENPAGEHYWEKHVEPQPQQRFKEVTPTAAAPAPQQQAQAPTPVPAAIPQQYGQQQYLQPAYPQQYYQPQPQAQAAPAAVAAANYGSYVY